MSQKTDGFTLIEMMFTVAILGILVGIGIVNYNSSIRKSSDALTKGNLGAIRTALSIYYGANDGIYPVDNLSSISSGGGYLVIIPITRLQPYHPDITRVTPEINSTETGGWSYNNVDGDHLWGTVRVGCLHQDSRAEVWSTY